jgi:hypothetical protein
LRSQARDGLEAPSLLMRRVWKKARDDKSSFAHGPPERAAEETSF